MALKYGKLAPRITPRSWRSMAIMGAALDKLKSPPDASNDYLSAVNVPWGMCLNDQLGCCVCADTAHVTMLRTANAGQIIVPTDDDVLKLYEAVGHYNPADPNSDGGCVEGNMCSYLQSTGFMGQKLDEWVNISPASTGHVKWTVQLFGSVRIGFQVPAFCQDQFASGQPWDVTSSGDQSIEGGHDVPIVGYEGDMFTVITWGKPQKMTLAFFQKYTDECHGELAFDWVRQQGTAPSGLDLNDLDTQLVGLRN